MGGKARKRREKNYLAAHGGDKRLPPPPNPSSIYALPSKLRKLMSFAPSATPLLQGSEVKSDNTTEHKTKKLHASQKDSKSTDNNKRDKRSTMPQVVGDEGKDNVNNDVNDEKKQKKRKRKQVNDLRFEAEMEKLGGISKRKQRKKEFLKAKKKKQKKGTSDEILDRPKRDEVQFGDVVKAPPKFDVIPKAPKKPMDASRERLRLQAIEAYRNRKGWTSRPGILLPSMSISSDL